CDKTRLKTAAHWKGGCFSQCRSCGFLFQNPPPTPAESRTFYETAYYEELKVLEQKIRKAREPLYREVLALLEPAKRTGKLLDVGAGFGDFMRAAQTAGWEAWGLEPSLEACQTARGDFGDRVICGT